MDLPALLSWNHMDLPAFLSWPFLFHLKSLEPTSGNNDIASDIELGSELGLKGTTLHHL